MKNNRVIMVSAGLLTPKKENNILNKRNLYPNYGLVSLATILKNRGYSPIVIHGDYKDPQAVIELMYHYGAAQSDHPILLSLPSFFSLEWAQIYCEKIQRYFKGKKVIVGGKWVVYGNEDWLATKLAGIESFVSVNAEKIIENLLEKRKVNDKCNVVLKSQPVSAHLNYTVVHDFKKYQPSIEIARGCGRGCSFCLEKDSPYQLMTSPKNVVLSILKHQNDYESQDITPYFQASFFRPNTNWCIDFLKYYGQYNLITKWRAQTRIDSLSIEKIELLSKAGLKILDLGLESANAQQILSMGKSKSPSKYLRKASQLLKICYENGIWTKLNILLYAGETLSTIRETEDWIKSHKKYIKGLSINPIFIYRHKDVVRFIQSLNELGASLVREDTLKEFGYAHLNLSSTMKFKKANDISLKIRQKMISDKDYYDLKSFSYFDRFYSFAHFKNDIQSINDDSLPFHKTDVKPRGSGLHGLLLKPGISNSVINYRPDFERNGVKS